MRTDDAQRAPVSRVTVTRAKFMSLATQRALTRLMRVVLDQMRETMNCDPCDDWTTHLKRRNLSKVRR